MQEKLEKSFCFLIQLKNIFQFFLLFLFQLDGGITTPPNELEDISEFGMFFSQVDGGNDDDEKIPGNFIFRIFKLF